MVKTTRFVVRPCSGDPQQFRSEEEARTAAVLAARQTGWADYYRVTGEIGTDIWDRPELLGGFEREEPGAGKQVA